jgi:hypothetical protein
MSTSKKHTPILIPAPKARNHRALFDKELPFQPKVEKSAKVYNRKKKHSRGDDSASF